MTKHETIHLSATVANEHAEYHMTNFDEGSLLISDVNFIINKYTKLDSVLA